MHACPIHNPAATRCIAGLALIVAFLRSFLSPLKAPRGNITTGGHNRPYSSGLPTTMFPESDVTNADDDTG